MILWFKDLFDHKDKEIVINEKFDGFTEEELQIEFPIKAKGSISIDSNILKVDLIINYNYRVSCDRCLKEILGKEDLVVSEKYKLKEIFIDEKLDTYQIVYENIMLNKRTKFLCKDECKGLCSVCGANLNLEGCDCEKEAINPKFAKLGKLLDR